MYTLKSIGQIKMANYQNELIRFVDSINSNLNRIASLGPSVALDIGNAKSELEQAKIAVTTNIDNIFDLNNRIKTETEQVTTNAKEQGTQSSEIRSKTKKLKEDIEKNRRLLDIREAQAQALQQKYDSNNYSSWLGLWRPLQPSSHIILIILSVFFGLVTMLTIVFYLRNFIPVVSLQKQQSALQSFFG